MSYKAEFKEGKVSYEAIFVNGEMTELRNESWAIIDIEGIN